MSNFLLQKKEIKKQKYFIKSVFFIIFIFFLSSVYFHGLAKGVETDFSITSDKIAKINIKEKIEENKNENYVYKKPNIISEKIEKPLIPALNQKNIIFPVDFSAKAIIVKDKNTGKVLFGENIYEKRSIASITKLMTALIFLEKDIDWEKVVVTIGDDNLGTHIYAGEEYSIEELWQIALIASSNKAILTLINTSDYKYDDFIKRMNQKAEELGMLDTLFTDPTGLEDSNVSTASDLVILLDEALKNEKIKNTLLIKDFNYYSTLKDEEKHLWNTDWLVLGWIKHNFEVFNGGKTGYIDASRYNFSMQAGDKDKLLNVVVLGAENHEDRFIEARNIADWVFDNYIWK